jgi:hypothetical protein
MCQYAPLCSLQRGHAYTRLSSSPEFQLDLAGLDKMDDEALWAIARSRKEPAELVHYDGLLEKNAGGLLVPAERDELERLREEADRFMLKKAHAAALLRWRGHRTVSP